MVPLAFLSNIVPGLQLILLSVLNLVLHIHIPLASSQMKRISHKPLPLCSNSTAQEQPPDTQTRQSVTDVNNELPSTMFPSYRLGSPSQVVYRQSRQPVEHGYQEFAGMKLPSYGSGSHSEILPREAPGITFPSYGFGVQSNASPSAPSFLANQTTAFRSLSRYSETEISNTASVNVAADKELDILQRRSPSPQMRKLGDTLFQYKPLDSTQSQIRLLRVLPGFYTSYIQCEVFEASLASPRPYIVCLDDCFVITSAIAIKLILRLGTILLLGRYGRYTNHRSKWIRLRRYREPLVCTFQLSVYHPCGDSVGRCCVHRPT